MDVRHFGPRTTIEDPERRRQWQAAQRVLAVRLDNLGDVLMTTPAFAAMKCATPRMHLCLLAAPGVAAARRHLSDVDAVIPYRAPWVAGEPGDSHTDTALIERLRAERFDAAVIFTVATQSPIAAALACRLADIPLRLAHCRENPYGLLSDWIPDADLCGPGMRHEVRRQLDLVASAGFLCHALPERMRFQCDDDDQLGMGRHFVQALREADIGGVDCNSGPAEPYFVVHPGATAASRRYPAERFGLAAAAIAQASGCRAVFCAGPDEVDLVDAAMRAMEGASNFDARAVLAPVSLAGRLSLGELAALIAGAEVVVCNNSGPAHLAAALGRPVAVTYALTNPQHTPWGVPTRVLNHEVPCRDCLKSQCPQAHHRCLLGVTPEAVAAAALDLMQRG